jgi:23S rRNA (uracil1939-C5)-methyltransferase
VQANRSANRALVSRAIDLLEPRSVDRVLDLYCGLGNFALPLARHAGEVIGVEGDERLLAWARRNARANGCDTVSFHGADLSQVPEAAQWARKSCDLVLLDPPRSGAAAILATIAAMRPRRICYVSCNPATLARDAGTLARSHRFSLEAAGVLDMFPDTSHVESIALRAR